MKHDIHSPPCTCGHYKHNHQTVSLRDWEGRCCRCPCRRYEIGPARDLSGTHVIVATRPDARPIADLRYEFFILVTYVDHEYGSYDEPDYAYRWWAEADVPNARVLLHTETTKRDCGRLRRDLDRHLAEWGWRRDT